MMDERLCKNIDSIMNLVKGHDWDWVMLIDGPERSGKSDLATQVQAYANNFSDPMKNIELSVWTFDGLKKVAIDAAKGSCITFHESGIYGREYKKKVNMEAVRVFTTIGAKNLLFIMTFPSAHMLDPYLRNHRIRTRGYVHTINGERGYVKWYVRPFGPWADENIAFIETFTSRFQAASSIYPELLAEVSKRDIYFKQNLLNGFGGE